MSIGLAIVGYGKMGRLIEQLAPEYDFDVRAKSMRATIRAARPFLIRLFRESTRLLNSLHRTLLRKTSAASPYWALTRLLVQPAGSNTFPLSAKLWQAAERALSGAQFLRWGEPFSCKLSPTPRRFLRNTRTMKPGVGDPPFCEKRRAFGTLKKLAEEMHANGYNRTVSLSSNRAGAHPGTHEIGFDSAADTITLRHTARSARVLRAARSARRAGSLEKKGYLNFARFSANYV